MTGIYFFDPKSKPLPVCSCVNAIPPGLVGPHHGRQCDMYREAGKGKDNGLTK